MFKDKYAKKAHEITQKYIETYGAHFGNIDDLDNEIASALREAVEQSVQRTALPLCFTASTYGVLGFPEKARGTTRRR